jgi:hypothetical protein
MLCKKYDIKSYYGKVGITLFSSTYLITLDILSFFLEENMRFKHITILALLFLSVNSFADWNTGRRDGQKILFVRLGTQAGGTNMYAVDFVGKNLNNFSNVTQASTLPSSADLSTYDQVWDLRWANSNTRVLSDADITKLQNYMKNDSGSLFLVGENSGFPLVNNPQLKLVRAMTKAENGKVFAESGLGYYNKGYVKDAAASALAENFNTDDRSDWTTPWTEWAGIVKLGELAGGYPVIKSTGTGIQVTANGTKISGWSDGAAEKGAVMVAWTPDNLADDYLGSKLVMFWDSQAFHLNSPTEWGLSPSHTNILKLMQNVYDFLSKTIEPATLTATPSSDDITKPHEYTGSSLDVELETNSSNTIEFRIISGTDTTAWDTSSSNIETVEISGDATIEANTIIGGDYAPVSGSWDYLVKRTAPYITTTAASAVSTESATSGGEVTGNGGEAVTDRGICWSTSASPDTSDFTTSDGIGIGSFTSLLTGLTGETKYYVRAYAINSEGISYGNEENFTTIVLTAADLFAESILVGSDGSDSTATQKSATDTVYFGHSLSVSLLSDGDEAVGTIKWTFDSADEADKANSWDDYLTPFEISDLTPYPDPHSDTVMITGRASGDDHMTTTTTFVFVRDTVSGLEVTASSKFINSIDVEIKLSDKWKNQKIYYTTGGEIPDSSSSSSLLYNKAFTVKSTTKINAIAYAANAVKSKVVVSQFTKVSGVESSWYKDSNGDGSIDQLIVHLTKKVEYVPDSLVLLSPFDKSEMVVVEETEIALSSDGLTLEADILNPFDFLTTKSTNFEIDSLGALGGAEYWDYSLDSDMFEINDSVAPVIISANYRPTEVTEGNEDKKLLDVLVVTFSEALYPKKPSTEKPFGFYDKSINSEFFDSFEIIEELSRDENTIQYSVEASNEFQPENERDSIRIRSTGGVVGADSVAQHEDTYWVPLKVSDYKYNWKIQVFPNPFSHTTTHPNAVDALENVTDKYDHVIGVFVTPIGPRSLSGSVKVDMRVLDALGNVVIDANGKNLVKISEGKMAGSYVHTVEPVNRNGKKLGSGTYIAILKLTHTGSTGEKRNSKKTVSIGIKN